MFNPYYVCVRTSANMCEYILYKKKTLFINCTNKHPTKIFIWKGTLDLSDNSLSSTLGWFHMNAKNRYRHRLIT